MSGGLREYLTNNIIKSVCSKTKIWVGHGGDISKASKNSIL